MRRFVLLCEELEARPGDADRVASLAGWFAEAGRAAALSGLPWLLPAEQGRRFARPPRLPLHRLRWAAREIAQAQGIEAWLFDAGAEACRDPAEAIALNLPDIPVRRASSLESTPTLAAWIDAWRAAGADEDPDERALAIVRLIAQLEDRPTRRWAIRAVAAMGRPTVEPWQWMRAWARAFDEDLAALAWRWHTTGRMPALSAQPDPTTTIPRPAAFLRYQSVEAHAYPERAREPHWRGVRVQVVRVGDAIALWHHEGELLNARLEALLFSAEWPTPAAIEGVLIGWHEGRIVSPWLAVRQQARTRASTFPPEATSLHLVLTDWHRWEEHDASAWPLAVRRARLRARWPTFEWQEKGTVPPPVFVTLDAAPSRAPVRFWNGHLLRATGPRDAPDTDVVGHLPAPRKRLRAVLQYVPADALAVAGRAALGLQPCGFALWTRTPRSARERAAGLAFSLAPLTEPDPDVAASLPAAAVDAAARLVPLARLALDLPDERLAHLHAWVRMHAGPRFGTSNTVLPALVFELSYDAAHPSRRHRAGWILEDARVEDWLEDAAAGAADELARLDEVVEP